MRISLHKEPSPKARLELFTTDINVPATCFKSAVRRKTETARTITHSPSTWHDLVIVVS